MRKVFHVVLNAVLLHSATVPLTHTAAADQGDVVPRRTASSVRGQQKKIRVVGFAFDSLRNSALAGAFVNVRGVGQNAISDSSGHFVVDSVPIGEQVFELQHDVLDSIGLSGIVVKVRIAQNTDTVRLGTPSFATLWANACGSHVPPADSGFVFGTISSVRDSKPVANAVVEAHWLDIGAFEKTKPLEKRWKSQGRADNVGDYAICGIPVGSALRMIAFTDSLASGSVDLAPNTLRVQRRDLWIAPVVDTTTLPHGVVIGLLLDERGKGVADARIALDGSPEERSHADGRFVIRNARAGSRQLQITSIGSLSASEAVNVLANDTARVSVTLRRVTALAAVAIKANEIRNGVLRELDERRRLGSGYVSDSTVFGHVGTLQAALSGFPSGYVRTGRGGVVSVTFKHGNQDCAAIVFIDGIRGDFEMMSDLRPSDIAAIEVYPHYMSIPQKFMTPNGQCGVVAVWTKWRLG